MRHSIEIPIEMFFDLVTLTFTYELDLDILPLDLHTKIQVCMSVNSAVRVVTHRKTDDAKTVTPNMSQTWGVMNWLLPGVVIKLRS